MIPISLILSIIRYVSRVNWKNPGKEYRPPLHLGVAAIEKGALWLPLTLVANFTFYFCKSNKQLDMRLKWTGHIQKEECIMQRIY